MPRTELAERWDVMLGEQAQTVLSQLNNRKDRPIREFDIPRVRQLSSSSREAAMPAACCLPACLIAMVIYIFASPDIKSSPVLVNYWICCCYSLDNCTSNLSLLPHHDLDINCLSLKLFISCLLSHPKPIIQQGCLKPLQLVTAYPSSLTKSISFWYYAPCKNFVQELSVIIW